MGASRIEQLIEDIYEFVESCKMQPLSSTKVIVPKDELYDLLDELRLRTPDEIKRYQKIIANRDAIIADAEEKAASMMEDAREKTSNLINEHEIMQQAYYQANEVVSEATEKANQIIASANTDANDIRAGALAYSEEKLLEVERILGQAFESTKSKYDGLLHSLEGNLDIVTNNRKELTDQLSGFPEEPVSLPPEEEQYDEAELREKEEHKHDFEVDEDAFFDDID